MKKSVLFRARKRWPLIFLGSIVVVGAAVTGWRLERLVENELPELVRGQLESALGRHVEIGRIHLSPFGFVIDGLRVKRLDTDAQDPLTAYRMRASVDWWGLAVRRQVKVTGLTLDRAQVHLPPGKAGVAGPTWAEQLSGLSHAGVERLSLRHSSVELAAAPGTAGGWSAQGLSGDLVFRSDRYGYEGKLTSLHSGDLALGAVSLAGTGDARGVRVQRASAVYQGAELHGGGTISAAENAVALKMHVDRMPLAKVAGQLGIPREWAVLGNLTGDVSLDAHRSRLTSIEGSLHVSRGSVSRLGERFPWTTATATLDWKPQGASLRDIRVVAAGAQLSGDGRVALRPGQPFSAGAFQLHGRLTADDASAVGRIARLVAFQPLVGGRATASGAAIDFQATGTVSDLARANAQGHLLVRGVRINPGGGAVPVLVDRLEADLARSYRQLTVHSLLVHSGVNEVRGELSLLDPPNGAAQLQGTATLVTGSLGSVARALPADLLPRWVPAGLRGHGELHLRVSGPLDGNPLHSEGSFDLHDIMAVTAGGPVEVSGLSGAFRQDAGRWSVSDLHLASSGVEVTGDAALDRNAADPIISTHLRLACDDWNRLPLSLRQMAPAVAGGRLASELETTAPWSRIGRCPIDGSLRVSDAALQLAGHPVALSAASMRFHWTGQALELANVELQSSLGKVGAHGALTPQGDQLQVALFVDAGTDQLNELAALFPGFPAVRGGEGSARVEVRGDLLHPADLTLGGEAELRKVTFLRSVPLLAHDEIEIRSAKAEFSRHGREWVVRRLAVDGPGFSAHASGTAAPGSVDARLELKADRWLPQPSLPLTGGSLHAAGQLTGDPRDLSQLSFLGTLEARNATASWTGREANVCGDGVSVVVRGAGVLSSPGAWLQSAEASLQSGRVRVGTSGERPVRNAALIITARDGGYDVTSAKAIVSGAELSGSGFWSPTAHHFQLTAVAQDIPALGLPLPAGVTVRSGRVEMLVEGNSADPLAAVSGQAHVSGVGLTLPQLPAQLVDQADARFQLSGGVLAVDDVHGHGRFGTLTASGEWSPAAARLGLTASGPEFSRLGLPLPIGIDVHGYRVHADFAGTPERPFATGSGELSLAHASFRFGPADPHRLSRIGAAFRLAPEGLALTGVTAEGPAGSYSGDGEIGRSGYRLALTSPSADPALLRWLAPGKSTGGHLSGWLDIAGDPHAPVREAHGHLVLDGLHYSAPAELGLLGDPVVVNRLETDYRWEAGRTDLRGLVVKSDLGTARGHLTAADGSGHLEAELHTNDGGRAADLWPVLNGKLRGSDVSGALNAEFGQRGFRGTLDLRAHGGTVVLPMLPEAYSTHPVETASVLLGFEPGKLTFQHAQLRGPKGNLDADGVWTMDGPVYGTGKAWFSKEYTRTLIKPSGWGWLARLAGIRQIRSDFTLGGTSDRVNLNAAITRTMLWKFAKGRVPKEFQQVAQGKSPLWVKPLEVAAQPAPPEPDAR